MKADLLHQAKSFTGLLKGQFKGRLVSVVLFGSVGRGEARADSDVDLLVVIRDLPPGRMRRRMLLDPAMKSAAKRGLTAAFNCHIRSPEEAKRITVMYFDFPYDAKVLHDRGSFFAGIIEDVRERIHLTGATRKRIGKFHYWDLKPGAKADDTFDIL